MIQPADGWDDDEREVVSELEAELEQVRRRHAGDPPPDVLRAARAGALPPDMQTRADAHLESSRWSRALAEGLESAPVDDLDAMTEARIWKHIKEHTATTRGPRRLVPPLALGGLAAAASVVVAVYLMRPQPVGTPQGSGSAPIASPRQPAPTPAVLTFSKPEVRLSPAALTWRSGTGSGDFLTDLEPAIEAYRASDYARANTAFASLATRYPDSFDVLYYQGLSRMFSGDFAGAVTPLSTAARLSDQVFAADVAWFLAVAEHRSGQTAAALEKLTRLCGGSSVRAPEACDAVKRIEAAGPGRP